MLDECVGCTHVLMKPQCSPPYVDWQWSPPYVDWHRDTVYKLPSQPTVNDSDIHAAVAVRVFRQNPPPGQSVYSHNDRGMFNFPVNLISKAAVVLSPSWRLFARQASTVGVTFSGRKQSIRFLGCHHKVVSTRTFNTCRRLENFKVLTW